MKKETSVLSLDAMLCCAVLLWLVESVTAARRSQVHFCARSVVSCSVQRCTVLYSGRTAYNYSKP